jgi:hypothetical protein
MSKRTKAQDIHRRAKIKNKRRREFGIKDKPVAVLGKCAVTTKHQYSKRDAEQAAENMMQREKYRVDFFYCNHCHYWHVGHDKRRGRLRTRPK